MTNLNLTQNINGIAITLVKGKWYRASRPMATKKNETFPIFIKTTEGVHVQTLHNGFTYDEANEFLSAFNNGETSWDGRRWGHEDED